MFTGDSGQNSARSQGSSGLAATRLGWTIRGYTDGRHQRASRSRSTAYARLVTGVLDGMIFTADVMGETSDRTSLGALTPGAAGQPGALGATRRPPGRPPRPGPRGRHRHPHLQVSPKPTGTRNRTRALPAGIGISGAQGIDLRERREPHRLPWRWDPTAPTRKRAPGSRSASILETSSAPPAGPPARRNGEPGGRRHRLACGEAPGQGGTPVNQLFDDDRPRDRGHRRRQGRAGGRRRGPRERGRPSIAALASLKATPGACWRS